MMQKGRLAWVSGGYRRRRYIESTTTNLRNAQNADTDAGILDRANQGVEHLLKSN
jgi:hypothetical protein